MKKFIYASIFIALFSFSAFADIRLPDTPKPTATTKPTATPKPVKDLDSFMIIRLNRNVEQATLIIPKDQISRLRAELEMLDDTGDLNSW